MQDEALSTPPLPSWRVLAGIVAAFLGLMFAVYGHSVTYDFVRWDDGMLVYENPAIRAITPSTLKHIFTTYDPELYIPLTFLTYQLEFQLAGQDASLYHFTNILLHSFNALFVAWFLYLLTRRGKLALVCGLLFLLHPLHTEAVEWVSARKDLLSTFFFLLTLVGYVSWHDSGKRRTYILSLVAFLLGLLSKVMVITLPVVLLLIDLYRGRRFSMAMLTEKIPYFALSVIFGIIGVFGKTGVIQSSTFLGKVLMACKSAVFYLQKIFIPVDFSLLYPYAKPITLASPDFYVPVLILIGIVAAAFFLRKRLRELPFGLAFFFLTVAPTFINFAKGGELDVYFASDRYAYVPSIGIFLAAAALVTLVLDSWRSLPRRQTELAATSLGVVVLAGCAMLSYRQSRVWQNTETLFTNVIRVYPESSHVAHNNLGNSFRLQGDFERAIAEYQKALGIRPTAKTFSNLGALYVRQKNFSLAGEQFTNALALNPQSKEGHFGMGLLAAAQGRLGDAEASYRKAVAIDPQYEQAFTNLGAVLMAENRVEEAVTAYESALAVNPYFSDAQYNLAVALTQLKRFPEAITQYERVIEGAPAFIPARINLALLYHQTGRTEDARAQFQEILRMDPQNRAARSALGQMGAGGR